jgi:putative NADH-flavin reductase
MAQSTGLPIADAHSEGRSTETGMKTGTLLVIGATRGTGRQVMQQARAAGYAVTALARDPARIDVPHDVPDQRLSVVRGDVLDPSSLAPAMADRDAVISTLGVTSRAPTTLYSAGMRNIIQAMRATGVRRLVAVSAAPLSIDDGDTLPSRLLLKPLLWALYRPVYADMAAMEDEIWQSGLDWTIVRPPRLTDRPPTGRYRTAINRSVRGGYSISRADLAAAILKLLDDPTSIRAAVGIGY